VRKVGLSEAKRKLSELVERAVAGERTAIIRDGKVLALIVPARTECNLSAIFNALEKIRKRARLPKDMRVKHLIEEGRS
jgi:prevent-host-death family protein